MASRDLQTQQKPSDRKQSGYTEAGHAASAAEETMAIQQNEFNPERFPLSTNARLQALLEKQTKAQETLTQLQAQRSALVAQNQSKVSPGLSEDEQTQQAVSAANATIKQHIALLTKYNEIKDIAQGLMGLIAEQRVVRMGVVMEEFGMGEKD